MPHFTRRSLAFLALAFASLAGGCTAVSEYSATQSSLGAPLNMSITLCASDGVPGSTYPTACRDEPIVDAVNQQLLVGYIVPNAAKPGPVSVTGAPAGTKLDQSASFTSWLTGWHTPPAGFRWVGYASNRLTAAPSGKVKISAPFEAPGASGAAPIGGDTHANMAVFSRSAASEAAAAAPVNCSSGCSHVYRFHNAAFETTFPTRDVSLTGVSVPVAVDPGTTVTLPFTLAYAGASPSGTLTPAVETTIPGATGALAPQAFDSTGSRSLPLKLAIPAKPTVGGEQSVKVTVPLGNGVARTAQVTLLLPPAPKQETGQNPPPAKTAAPATQTQRTDASQTTTQSQAEVKTVTAPPALAAGRISGAKLRSGLTLTQVFPGAGTATVDVKLGAKRVGRATVKLTAAGKRVVKVRWSAAGRKALKGRRRARLRVRVAFVDNAGRKATRTVSVSAR